MLLKTRGRGGTTFLFGQDSDPAAVLAEKPSRTGSISVNIDLVGTDWNESYFPMYTIYWE